jgi:hypothetical protein
MELSVKDKIVLFDDEDAELVLRYKWHISVCGRGKLLYATTSNYTPKLYGNDPIRMHKLVMGMPEFEVDHINRNTLDNRRGNLRLVTRVQNCANSGPRRGTSKFKGVSWNKGKWRAVIMIDSRQISLGRYTDELEAAAAYDKAAKSAWGEFAYQNLDQSW